MPDPNNGSVNPVAKEIIGTLYAIQSDLQSASCDTDQLETTIDNIYNDVEHAIKAFKELEWPPASSPPETNSSSG